MFAKARQRDDKLEKLIYTVTGKGNKWQLSESIGIGFALKMSDICSITALVSYRKKINEMIKCGNCEGKTGQKLDKSSKNFTELSSF